MDDVFDGADGRRVESDRETHPAFGGPPDTPAQSVAAQEDDVDAYTHDPAPEVDLGPDGAGDAQDEPGDAGAELLEVRATVNMRGLSRGQVTMVDPSDPTIAMLLAKRAIVPADA